MKGIYYKESGWRERFREFWNIASDEGFTEERGKATEIFIEQERQLLLARVREIVLPLRHNKHCSIGTDKYGIDKNVCDCVYFNENNEKERILSALEEEHDI